MTQREQLLSVLRMALQGESPDWCGVTLEREAYIRMMLLAQEQTVVGLLGQAVMDSQARLNTDDVLTLVGTVQQIRLQNALMDNAVVELSQKLKKENIRFLVVKGQTLAALYSDKALRQSGDVDFLVHFNDWQRAILLVKSGSIKSENYSDTQSLKHVEWQSGGVQYEMHKILADFAAPAHKRYWDNVVMEGLWEHPFSIEINCCSVPTLAPIYNILYTFVHIFNHLIVEGIGLRQFCDLYKLLVKFNLDEEEAETLKNHLRCIGMLKGFTAAEAVLTDFLGMEERLVPIPILQSDHKIATMMMDNIMEMGNFGQNKQYAQSGGLVHAIQHLVRIALQSRKFYKCAPAEARWRIPHMLRWWGCKVYRKMSNN